VATFVVDANRILSALLKDGTTRRAILGTSSTLVAPVFLLEEVAKHRPEIARRVGVPPEALGAILDPILRRIKWIKPEVYAECLPSATKALGAVDMKDVPYLACAIAVGADAIWSHDKDFDRQALVPRISRLGEAP
jgi:predicted nucleic acid-binding protein